MNILQVINVRWFNAEAAYAYSLAKGLIKKGHKVIVLGLPNSPVIEKAKADRIQVYETRHFNTYNPVSAMAGLRGLVRLIDREDIEVINCHRSEGYPVVALAAIISKRHPRLVRTRGDVREVQKGPLNRIFYTRFADGVIASGEVIRKGLIERLGLPEEMVDVVYAAVDTERFRPLNTYKDIRKELGIPSDSPLIAILGRLGEVKGHRYFIEAASLILNEHPSARFLIVAKEMGEGAERLKRKVAGAGLDGKVLFTGFREDLLEVMASCDIGVVSSIGSEANCRVVLEWMAMGKPVVATTAGVIPEVLRDGETGYLVAPKDSLAISKAVNMLLSDREKAISFGNNGRKLAESVYNQELFVENTLEVYRNAMKHHRGR